jgi:hypothetical protein
MADALYHGSNEELDELEGNDPGYRGSLGYGLYLTSDEDFASVFGKNIYKVESPVPDELVAYLQPDTYECGQSLVVYTPGSSPFTFNIEDRKTGEQHRYSVLEDCEGEVKDALGVQALDRWKLTPELLEQAGRLPPETRPLVEQCFKGVMDELRQGNFMATEVCEEPLGEAVEGGLDEQVADSLKALMDSIVDSALVFQQAEVERILGEEVSLDELSNICERHGYSAFHIEGYSPGGDEYVIFDDAYLPVKVLSVE